MKPFNVKDVPKIDNALRVVFRDGSTGYAWQSTNGRLCAEYAGNVYSYQQNGRFGSMGDYALDIIGVYKPPIVQWAVVNKHERIEGLFETEQKALDAAARTRRESANFAQKKHNLTWRVVKLVETSNDKSGE